MRELTFVAFVLTFIIIACNKKTVATKYVPTTETAESAATEMVKSTVETADDDFLTAGKVVYQTKCTRCHGMKQPASFSSVRWDGILKLMIPKTNLTATEIQQVTGYVKSQAKK